VSRGLGSEVNVLQVIPLESLLIVIVVRDAMLLSLIFRQLSVDSQAGDAHKIHARVSSDGSRILGGVGVGIADDTQTTLL